MTTQPALAAVDDDAAPLSNHQLRELYTLMAAVRHLDTSAVAWQRQGIIPGYAPELGQEAAQVGSGYAVDLNRDFVFPTYREMGVARAMGLDKEEEGRVGRQRRIKDRRREPARIGRSIDRRRAGAAVGGRGEGVGGGADDRRPRSCDGRQEDRID